VIVAAVFFVCAASAAPLDAPLAKLDELSREQNDKPADEIRALDKRIAALEKDFAAAGPSAAPPLGRIAVDASKPLKERVWAVNFLGLLSDPAAFAPLSELSLDREQPEVVRAAAVSGLASTGVGSASLRATACGALAQDDLPAEALREAALLASRVGCDEPKVLSRRAKDYGVRPRGEPASLICALSISALARSHPVAAARELFSLFDFYRSGAPERGLVLMALREQLDNLKTFQAMAVAQACAALSAEARAPGNAVAALRLIAALDGRACEPTLLRELENADAEVVAVDAEVLADLKIAAAKKPLALIVDAAIDDPRFAPQKDRPAPTALLERIQRAYNRLP